MIVYEFDDYSYPLHQSGYVSTLPQEDPDFKIEALRQSVFEITGLVVEPVEKQKMGFY